MATTAAQDRLRKPLMFEAVDPRGNLIVCSQSTWDGHIAKEHPEMYERLSQVVTTITAPDAIRESTARPDAQVFERACEGPIQIRVVVTYDDPFQIDLGLTIAKVNTAFPVQSEEYDHPHVGAYIYTRPADTGGSR